MILYFYFCDILIPKHLVNLITEPPNVTICILIAYYLNKWNKSIIINECEELRADIFKGLLYWPLKFYLALIDILTNYSFYKKISYNLFQNVCIILYLTIMSHLYGKIYYGR